MASTAVEQGRQTVSAAAEAAGQTVGTATEGAKQVASEAAQQVTERPARPPTRPASSSARPRPSCASRPRAQTQKAAGGLADVGRPIRAMSEGQTDQAGFAADAAKQPAEKVEQLADRLERRGFDGTIGALYGIAAAVLITRGRDQMKHVDPVPRQTLETLKEDAEWVKAQKS